MNTKYNAGTPASNMDFVSAKETSLVISTMRTSSQFSDLVMLSGYEREHRFRNSKLWDECLSLPNIITRTYIAYLIPSDKKTKLTVDPDTGVVTVKGRFGVGDEHAHKSQRRIPVGYICGAKINYHHALDCSVPCIRNAMKYRIKYPTEQMLSIAVHPNCRRNYIGSNLVKHFVFFLEYQRVIVFVDVDDVAMCNLLRDTGFRVTRECTGINTNGMYVDQYAFVSKIKKNEGYVDGRGDAEPL